jgi:hypothetical protein
MVSNNQFITVVAVLLVATFSGKEQLSNLNKPLVDMTKKHCRHRHNLAQQPRFS